MSAGRRTLTAVAAVATVGLLLALALVLSRSGHHRTATNGFVREDVAHLEQGQSLCQPAQDVPEGTARIRFRPASPGPAGPLEVAVHTADGPEVATGRVPATTYDPGRGTVARIKPIEETIRGARVCFGNTGPARVDLYGQRLRHAAGAAELPPPDMRWLGLRIDYLEGQARSWWSFAPEVADRFGLVKATRFGSWTFWAEIVLLLGLTIGTIWYAARAVAR